MWVPHRILEFLDPPAGFVSAQFTDAVQAARYRQALGILGQLS